MSEHPFQRMFRNAAACLLAWPLHDASTPVGRLLLRWSLAAMYPPDRRWVEFEHPTIREVVS